VKRPVSVVTGLVLAAIACCPPPRGLAGTVSGPVLQGHPMRSSVSVAQFRHPLPGPSRPIGRHRPVPPHRRAAGMIASGWVGSIQRCIAHYESHGNLRAHNPAGYWGRYQFADGLWFGTTGLRGHASQYDAAIQDAAFLAVFDGGRGRSRWSTYPLCRSIYGGPA
jgi:Transglycosylase-like domain